MHNDFTKKSVKILLVSDFVIIHNNSQKVNTFLERSTENKY